MSYTVEVEFAAAYELVVSCYVFTQPQHYRTLELPSWWPNTVRKQLGETLLQRIPKANHPWLKGGLSELGALVRQYQGHPGVEEFVRWLTNVSGGELYDLLAPVARGLSPDILSHLNEFRDFWADLLQVWYEHYYRTMDPQILHLLEDSAATLRQVAGITPASQVVTLASRGIQIEADTEFTTVVLVPQYHFSPWNLILAFGSVQQIFYPVDRPVGPGEPPRDLVRVTKALGDENRLRILQFIAQAPRPFMEVVQFSRLSKGTVHHHLVALRAAGLVVVRERHDIGSTTYELREDAADAVAQRLREFLFGC